MDSEPKPPASATGRFLTYLFMTFGVLWMLMCGLCTAVAVASSAMAVWELPSFDTAALFLLTSFIFGGLGWLFGRIGNAVYRHNKALKDKVR